MAVATSLTSHNKPFEAGSIPLWLFITFNRTATVALTVGESNGPNAKHKKYLA